MKPRLFNKFFRGMNRRRIAAVFLLAAVAASAVYISPPDLSFLRRGYHDHCPGFSAGDISTLTLEEMELSETIDVSGRILFREKVNISSRINGRLSGIYVREGRRVSAGELIAEIERLPLEISLKQQQSELDIARKAYELAEAGYSDALKGVEIRLKSIKKAEADLNDKRVSYQNMKNILNNRERLFEAGGVSRTELENIRTEYTTLYTRYALAEADLEIQRVGYRDSDIIAEGFDIPGTEKKRIEIFKLINTKIERAEREAARSRVSQAENNLKATKIMLDETYIRSPISGIAASRNMEAGEMVREDSIITTIIDISEIYVSINLNESGLRRVSPGQEIIFTVDALGPEKSFTGKIETVAPVLDTRTGTVEVKALAGNPGGELLPGMFARGTIKTGKKERGLLVPESALIRRDDGGMEVYVLKNSIVFRERVVTGAARDNLVRVKEGLSPGDIIIVSGINSVYRGMRID